MLKDTLAKAFERPTTSLCHPRCGARSELLVELARFLAQRAEALGIALLVTLDRPHSSPCAAREIGEALVRRFIDDVRRERRVETSDDLAPTGDEIHAALRIEPETRDASVFDQLVSHLQRVR